MLFLEKKLSTPAWSPLGVQRQQNAAGQRHQSAARFRTEDRASVLAGFGLFLDDAIPGSSGNHHVLWRVGRSFLHNQVSLQHDRQGPVAVFPSVGCSLGGDLLFGTGPLCRGFGWCGRRLRFFRQFRELEGNRRGRCSGASSRLGSGGGLGRWYRLGQRGGLGCGSGLGQRGSRLPVVPAYGEPGPWLKSVPPLSRQAG